MAFQRTIVISLLLSFILSHLSGANLMENNGIETPQPQPQPPQPPQSIDCGAACKIRCQESSRPNLCNRACGSCCVKCKCVPSGTYGNYEACPCYFNQTTHNNTRKCP